MYSIITGEEKWIARYLFLKTKFYEMENVSRMERVEVACDTYRAKHSYFAHYMNILKSNIDET